MSDEPLKFFGNIANFGSHAQMVTKFGSQILATKFGFVPDCSLKIKIFKKWQVFFQCHDIERKPAIVFWKNGLILSKFKARNQKIYTDLQTLRMWHSYFRKWRLVFN